MNSFVLRFDLSGDVTVQRVLASFSDANAYVYAVEGQETQNPHVHAMFTTDVQSATQRARVRAINPKLKGNGKYSLKKCKDTPKTPLLDDTWPIYFLSYLLKEFQWIEKETYFNIPKHVIEATLARQQEYLDSVEQKKEDKKTPTWKKIMESIPKETKYYEVETIYRYIVDYHIEKSLIIREHQCKAYFTTIHMNMFPERIRNTLQYWAAGDTHMHPQGPLS